MLKGDAMRRVKILAAMGQEGASASDNYASRGGLANDLNGQGGFEQPSVNMTGGPHVIIQSMDEDFANRNS